ncbi:MAG TPA: hypothetical protein VHO27_12120 [Angustibacter sp.]|nr:hypothetical protein [Angustibacter sp.]
MSSKSISPEDQFLGEHHVYEPHRIGLPRLGPYFRELWRRRGFAFELARTQMHAANTDTVLGQAWLVLNPLLLASVYFLLVNVIAGGNRNLTFFAHLTAGLFLFTFITGSMSAGATSVTSSGRLILNTSFPRMLLPLSSTWLAFRRFLPTLVVYAVLHVLSGRAIGVHLLWAIPILALSILLAAGLAMLIATAQVYFRDTASFLPYVIRIWLYVSPVLWLIEDARKAADDGSHGQAVLLAAQPYNPLYGVLGSWAEVLIEGHAPSWGLVVHMVAWSVGLLVVGGLVFMSREREFSVRL